MRRLLGWIGLSFIPAVIGLPFPAPDYYARLRKPGWAPAPSIFGPVWTILYVLMGVAAWIVSRGRPAETRAPLRLWATQLALNATWTPIFFGLRSPGIALANIILLWAALAITVVAFWSRRVTAGAILLPYLAWVTFATALNYSIWRRNR